VIHVKKTEIQVKLLPTP